PHVDQGLHPPAHGFLAHLAEGCEIVRCSWLTLEIALGQNEPQTRATPNVVEIVQGLERDSDDLERVGRFGNDGGLLVHVHILFSSSTTERNDRKAPVLTLNGAPPKLRREFPPFWTRNRTYPICPSSL